jgi:hypothetical protein
MPLHAAIRNPLGADANALIGRYRPYPRENDLLRHWPDAGLLVSTVLK